MSVHKKTSIGSGKLKKKRMSFNKGDYCRISYDDQLYECQVSDITGLKTKVQLIGHDVNLEVDKKSILPSLGKSTRVKQEEDAKICKAKDREAFRTLVLSLVQMTYFDFTIFLKLAEFTILNAYFSRIEFNIVFWRIFWKFDIACYALSLIVYAFFIVNSANQKIREINAGH